MSAGFGLALGSLACRRVCASVSNRKITTVDRVAVFDGAAAGVRSVHCVCGVCSVTQTVTRVRK